MTHRIVVLGAGYAGAYAAGVLARRLHPDDTEITVVNARADFVERLRLHQLAAGQDLQSRPLADVFAGTGVRLRLGRVTAVDPDARTVAVADTDGGAEIGYDTLVYALGSTAADQGVPGVAQHAFHVAGRATALRLRRRLDALDAGATVTVVGGNLTGIEAAVEIAESRPELRVTLATSGELGGWLSAGANRHLRRAFDRFGITVHEHTEIETVEAKHVIGTDGTAFPADTTVWAAGFAVHPIAAASGLTVADNGQIVVDRLMRSVSHPEVYAAGDSAYAIGNNGRPLPMSCASAGFTSGQAIAAIISELTGRRTSMTPLLYVGNHIGLGRRDTVIQAVDDQLRPRWHFGGRFAAGLKNAILTTAAWTISHPTFGRPVRRFRLAPSHRALSLSKGPGSSHRPPGSFHRALSLSKGPNPARTKETTAA